MEMEKVVNTLSWKLGGEAGFGIMSAGLIFAKACSRGGLNVFVINEYPSLIRGGHNVSHVWVMEREITSQYYPVDLLVALNEETVELHKNELNPGGGILYDGDKITLTAESLGRDDVNLYHVPLEKIATETGERTIMRNSVALGASIALADYDLDMLNGVIRDTFAHKGDKVVNPNLAAAKGGYDYIKENYPADSFRFKLSKIKGREPKPLISGSEAISLGAIQAGCKFYSAYPMTPASPILHFMAAHERRFGMIVKHTEDEIAAMNMAIGAAYAGVRAMTATSGGGFCLMSEALGLAGNTEVPVVVVVAQRPGPATGLATWTAQGDLRFAIHAAQGEFPRLVAAPGDMEECFYTTINAHNFAERYQVPVIILEDKYLAESSKSVEKFNVSNVKLDRGCLAREEDLEAEEVTFKRYEFTETGISTRAFPGQKGGIHNVGGEEHDVYGFMSEDAENRRKMVEKRMRKLELAAKELPKPKLYGDESSDLLVIGWGSTKCPMLEAMRVLEEDGLKVKFLHLIWILPFPTEEVRKFMDSSAKTVLVEGNFTSQLGSLIRENTGKVVDHKILKYDGRPFYPEDIVRGIKEVV